jgi:hypothetical protein
MTTAKTTERTFVERLAAGTAQHFAPTDTLKIANGIFSRADVEATLQAFVDLRTAVDAARTALQAKLVAEANQSPALRERIHAIVAYVRATFGNSPDILTDFGLKPKKARTPLTVEQRAAASEKRAATRKARHTMGKRQKRQIKGTVTTLVVTPSDG